MGRGSSALGGAVAKSRDNRQKGLFTSCAFAVVHRPEVRRRDGAPLQHQPADRVTDCRPASSGQPIAQDRYKTGQVEEQATPGSKKPRSKPPSDPRRRPAVPKRCRIGARWRASWRRSADTAVMTFLAHAAGPTSPNRNDIAAAAPTVDKITTSIKYFVPSLMRRPVYFCSSPHAG